MWIWRFHIQCNVTKDALLHLTDVTGTNFTLQWTLRGYQVLVLQEGVVWTKTKYCEIYKCSKNQQPKQKDLWWNRCTVLTILPAWTCTEWIAVYHCRENEMLKVKCWLWTSLLLTLAYKSYIALYYGCI